MNDNQLHVNIARYRRWLGVSQISLARAIGAGQSHLSNIESGKQALTDVMLERIAKALNTTPDKLRRGGVE